MCSIARCGACRKRVSSRSSDIKSKSWIARGWKIKSCLAIDPRIRQKSRNPDRSGGMLKAETWAISFWGIGMTKDNVQPIPLIDIGRCDGCGLCVRACANNVLAVHEGKAFVAQPESCEYTGLCALICLKEAIQLPYEVVCVEPSVEVRPMPEPRFELKQPRRR